MSSPMVKHAMVSQRQAKVTRVVVIECPEADPEYARVEFVIGGHTFVMTGPDAQVIGHSLAQAGGRTP